MTRSHVIRSLTLFGTWENEESYVRSPEFKSHYVFHRVQVKVYSVYFLVLR
jgi:hypothetical protein